MTMTFGMKKLEWWHWWGYQAVKKFDMFSRFDTIPACDGF